ncbi:hypothetical protein SFC43_00450 [Bacteroides sp. CR5/BHMF/2]|nr:hypothetical protein [Bacteroides sp. CR5/BHMF/2]
MCRFIYGVSNCIKRYFKEAYEVIRERSVRENNDKLTAHPAFKVLFDALEATRKQLRELGLTFQTLSASDDDEVNDLINEVNKIDCDGEGE